MRAVPVGDNPDGAGVPGTDVQPDARVGGGASDHERLFRVRRRDSRGYFLDPGVRD